MNRLKIRIRRAKHREDILKTILQCEIAGFCPTVDDLAKRLQYPASRLPAYLQKMADAKQIIIKDDEIHLSSSGKQQAIQLLRAHRLWETYLARFTGHSARSWHHQAEQKEHQLTPSELAELERSLGQPRYDPHGDPIPTEEGHIERIEGQPLLQIPPNELHKIIHIADEPPARYAQLAAQNIAAGCKIVVIKQTLTAVDVIIDGRPQTLTNEQAQAIVAFPTANGEWTHQANTMPLSELNLGEQAEVINISYACRSNERRRLLDLGILPGTIITAELLSPSGDPKAYRVRGALIALRHQQANWITVKRIS